MQKPKMVVLYAVQILTVMEYYRKKHVDVPSALPSILTLKRIQVHSNIKSLHLMEQVACTLRKKGIIRSYKGPNGGYALVKDPCTVTINDIDPMPEDKSKNAPSTHVINELSQKFNECASAFYSMKLGDIPKFGTKESFSSILV